MPTGRSIEAGRAFLRLMVEDENFKRGLANSLNKLEKFGKTLQELGPKLGLAGAAITAPFIKSLTVFADVGRQSEETAELANKLRASLDSLKASATAVGSAFGEALAPAIIQLSKVANANLSVLTAFVQEHSRLITAIGAAGTGSLALAGIFTALGLSAQGAAVGIRALSVSLAFFSKHPYIAAAGVIATLTVGLAAKFGYLTDEMESATTALDKLADHQKDLATTTTTATDAIVKQSEAVETHAQKLERLEGRLAQLRRASVFEQVGVTREEGLARNAALIADVEGQLKRARFGIETALAFQGTLAGFFGPLIGMPQMLRVLADNQFDRRGKGKPGFSSPDQQFDNLSNVLGAIGTFSGRHAEQIFGRGRAFQKQEEPSPKILRHNAKMLEWMRKIEENTRRIQSLGPVRVGNS